MAETTTLATIDAETLKKDLQSENPPVLINTLGKDAYRARRIPGSINVPYGEIEKVEDIVPDTNQRIVVYCANEDCEASPTAARKLEELGYTRVEDFEAGYKGWRQAGYELIGEEA